MPKKIKDMECRAGDAVYFRDVKVGAIHCWSRGGASVTLSKASEFRVLYPGERFTVTVTHIELTQEMLDGGDWRIE